MQQNIDDVKRTALWRSLDSLGRVVIPNEFFKELELSPAQEMEITIEYGEICIKKFQSEDFKSRPFVGFVRKLDVLHRVVIPSEYLNLLEIERKNMLALRMENGVVKVLAKMI